MRLWAVPGRCWVQTFLPACWTWPTAGFTPWTSPNRFPHDLLGAYCLRGKGEREGTFAIGPELRAHVSFRRANLTRPLPDLGLFDVVFLRNVMIYFSSSVKQAVLRRVIATIRPGGNLLIGHAESLVDADGALERVGPSVFRRKSA